VSQILSSAAFRVESILEDLPAENESLQREVAKVRFLMKKAGQEVRRISENLRPSELDELGLVPAVRDLCEDFRERTQLSVQLLAPTPERFSSDLELALYRVVQEALTNIEKHASASEVILRLSWDEAFVTLRIRDNGKGLTSGPKEGGPRKRLGMGLVDMKERCAFLGGGLSIRSEPGTGTEIAARIPRTAARAESVA
jgi:two-component system, NarL family, sensor kinase